MTTGQTPAQNPSSHPAGPRLLRIGVILGDKIVEEKLIRDNKPVTIGQSGKNTFPVPSTELPRSFTLFQKIRGQTFLCVSASMDGRVSDGPRVETLEQIRTSGRVARQGQIWQIHLSDDARGKIIVGDLTLLFQFVPAPPLQPKPQLPQAVLGSFADRVDPYLAVILSVSMVAHLLVWGYFKYVVEEAKPVTPDVIPDQFAHVVMERPKPPPAPPEQPGPEKPVEETKKETDRKEPSKAADRSEPMTRETITARVESAAPIRVLRSLSAKGQGPLAIGSDNKAAWDDLDKGLAKVGTGDVVASVGTQHQETRGTGTAEVASGKEVGVTGPSGPRVTGAEKVEEEVRVTGRAERIVDIDSGGLNPDKVASTIRQRYQARVNACYQRALKSNPNLGGKVTVSFTVGIAGNVVKASADGFDSGVDQCIAREARTWRFDKPEAPAVFEIPFILRRAN